jgi:hypothetical protein
VAPDLPFESIAKLCIERIVSAYHSATWHWLGECDGIPWRMPPRNGGVRSVGRVGRDPLCPKHGEGGGVPLAPIGTEGCGTAEVPLVFAFRNDTSKLGRDGRFWRSAACGPRQVDRHGRRPGLAVAGRVNVNLLRPCELSPQHGPCLGHLAPSC